MPGFKQIQQSSKINSNTNIQSVKSELSRLGNGQDRQFLRPGAASGLALLPLVLLAALGIGFALGSVVSTVVPILDTLEDNYPKTYVNTTVVNSVSAPSTVTSTNTNTDNDMITNTANPP